MKKEKIENYMLIIITLQILIFIFLVCFIALKISKPLENLKDKYLNEGYQNAIKNIILIVEREGVVNLKDNNVTYTLILKQKEQPKWGDIDLSAYENKSKSLITP